jgi:hypothetical protein
MADVNPQTTFHVALSEREYNLVMMCLAIIAGAAVKPDGHHKKAAAELNQQLLARENQLWDERKIAVGKKIEKAPVPDGSTE